MIENCLKKIGLSEKEIKVYLICLKLGAQPASNISLRTNLARATVYDVFSTLMKKGLVSKSDRAGTTIFEVVSPENLLNFLDREKNDFIRKKEKEKQEISEIIPLLKSIEIEKTSKPKVRFFEGKKGLREAYMETLKSVSPIRSYANVQTMHQGLPDFFPDYYALRSKRDIFIRAIVQDNELGRERSKKDLEEAREIKFVDKDEYEFSPEVNIYNDRVLYSSWKEKMAVSIESQEIADFHKKMFDLLWKKLD